MRVAPPPTDNLSPAEADLLLALHEAFVETGDATWEADDE